MAAHHISKRLLLVVMVCAMSVMGCEAFSEHAQEQEILSSLGLIDPITPANPNANLSGIQNDLTHCSPVRGVQVIQPPAADEATVTGNTVWAEGAAVRAVKVSDFSTDVVASVAEQTLTLRLKRTVDGMQLCSAKLGTTDQAYQILSGVILVDRFNVAAEDRVMNSGSFDLTFAPSNGATKAVGILLDATVVDSASVRIHGTYFTDTLLSN